MSPRTRKDPRPARRTPATFRTSDAAVRAATGRTRDEWLAVLDAWGGADRPHKAIAAWLMDTHAVAGWWAQTLTVDYEQARGLRAPGGGRDGTFTVGASKTVPVSIERLFAAFMDAGARARWLPGAVRRGGRGPAAGQLTVARRVASSRNAALSTLPLALVGNASSATSHTRRGTL